MKRPKFINGEIYHIYNRGVEKRNIFLDNSDRFRFIHNLFEFNDTAPALNIYYKNSYEARPRKVPQKVRTQIVDILAFCMMDNHYHLLVRQRGDNGISKFMQKLGTGWTMYFNQKYQRTGALFQGLFKAVHVNKDEYFIHIPYYIHFNPLDFITPEWRNRELKDYKKAIKYLENYRWSSHLDYCGIKNFPSVTNRELLIEFFGGPEEYKKTVLRWLEELDINSIEEMTLE